MRISKQNKMRENLQRQRERKLGMTKGQYNFKGWLLIFFLFFFLLRSETKICKALGSVCISIGWTPRYPRACL